eukprot:8814-Heterococcus_DN1.PRE.1
MPDLQVASTRTELACAVACSAVTLSTVTEYPNLLYPVFQLQTRMRALTLDISGWEKVTARIDAINRQKAKASVSSSSSSRYSSCDDVCCSQCRTAQLLRLTLLFCVANKTEERAKEVALKALAVQQGQQLLAKAGSNRSANGGLNGPAGNANSNSSSRSNSDKHLLAAEKQPSKRGFTAATVAPTSPTGASAAATDAPVQYETPLQSQLRALQAVAAEAEREHNVVTPQSVTSQSVTPVSATSPTASVHGKRPSCDDRCHMQHLMICSIIT